MPHDPRFIDGDDNPQQYEPNFIDRQPVAGPFDGLLVIMNMPEGGFRREYDEVVGEAIKQAHADGWLVMYVADGLTGLHRPPAHYDEVDGMDHFRLFSSLGISDEFDYIPSIRMAQFGRMAEAIASRGQEFGFPSRRLFAKVVGACKIGGVASLVPPTDVKTEIRR